MIITIAGEGGSGKTTVARMLAEKLGYEHVSAGGIRRAIAAKHNMTIDELNEIAKTEFWSDKECDDHIEHIGRTQDNVVIDSWMAWHFVPHSFKVFLSVQPEEAARRVFAHQRPTEQKQHTVKDMQELLLQRHNNNVDRYKHYYQVDFMDKKHYNLILDSTHKTPEEIAEKILAAATKADRAAK